MKNISISKMIMVVIMAFFLAFITDFSNTFSHTTLPNNATFDDFYLVIEISFVSSLKSGISAIMSSILAYLVNNQKGEGIVNG
jgi:hypothetical protein